MSGMRLIVAIVLAGWLALIIRLGVAGVFVTPVGTPPLPIAIGFAVPVLIFGAAFWLSTAFRAFVLGLDLSLLAGIQAWRFAGLGFLALYANRILPGGFALPAGLGDMAIGLTAPWIAVALTRRRGFAGSSVFRIWNALGVLDLAAAIASGVITSVRSTGVDGGITMAAMPQLPLVLIPAYLVPIFLMLHIASFAQARGIARA